MKWAEPGEVLRAGFAQAYVVADDANDISLQLEVLREVVGVGHAVRRLSARAGLLGI